MSTVIELRCSPLRAIVIRALTTGRNRYMVAATMRATAANTSEFIGPAHTVPDLTTAWETARAESKRTGFPIIDITSPPRRPPNGPGGGGTRMAA